MASDSSQELVDWIDEEGRTIGTVTRREMRERRLSHRCVYVLVFDRQGRLFVHLRTATKDVYPSHWDPCIGGVLAAGESFDEGARREASEELGVSIEPERLFPFRYADTATVVQGMVYRAVHEGPFRLQAEEVVRGEFVPVEEVIARGAKEQVCPDGLGVLERLAQLRSGPPL
jgi:isopentenyldiphosphate isomerase